jgi:hypothetical protein
MRLILATLAEIIALGLFVASVATVAAAMGA